MEVLYKARNVDDHVELAHQVLFEIEGLILCAEDEGEADAEFPAVMPDLCVIEAGLKALYADRGSDRRRQQRAPEGFRARLKHRFVPARADD